MFDATGVNGQTRTGHPLSGTCRRALYGSLWPIVTILIAILTLSAVPRAYAQMATAQISGTVHDQTGALIPGAQIQATQTATGVKSVATANGQGLFSLPSLAVGTYTVEVSASGFALYRQTNLVLTVGQQLTLDIALKIGGSEQVVTVTAGTVAVDSSSPTQQNTIEEKTVQDLPLNGRNPADLVFTVAGVNNAALNIASIGYTSTIKPPDSTNPNESAPSVHGVRAGGTYFSLDGANNSDPYTVIGGPFPNPDATGEFSVVTGTYGAGYVSAPGGAVNIVTRSGTNQLHGAMFEFIRNGYFNARDPLSGGAPDILKRNQFGGAVGGPILHDRLFFFASYQGTTVRNNTTTVDFVPTAPERTGDFGTFQIPSYLISPAIQKYLQYLPVGEPTSGQISVQTPANNTGQQGTLKLDYNLKGHRLFARGFYDRYVLDAAPPTAAAGALSEAPGFIQPWSSFAAGDSWNAGKWVLNTRFSYIRELSTQTRAPQLSTFSNLGITGVSGGAPDPGYVLFYVNSGFEANYGDPNMAPRNEYEVAEDVITVRGRHQLSFGANYRRVDLHDRQIANDPVAVFAGVNSLLYGEPGLTGPGAPPIIPGATLNPMADFIMGAPYIFLQSDSTFMDISANLFGAYAEDNYRVTDKLTATVGLRWDPYFPYRVAGQKLACFVPNEQSAAFVNAPVGEVFPGDSNCPQNGLRSSYVEFQPRVGLAYKLDQGATALRAGYGRYNLQSPLQPYTEFKSQPWVRNYELQQPFLSINNVWATAGTTDPFASGFHGPDYNPPSNVAFLPGTSLSEFDQNTHPAYIQQWSLSFQHLFTTKDSMEIAYNGTAGVHLPIVGSLNTSVNGVSPYPQFGIIGDSASIATSSYHGLDFTYKHQDKLITVNSVLTWSHAMDDASEPGFGSNVSIPNLNHNFRRATTDFDQTIVSRTTGTWNLPSLQGDNALARALVGSWIASGLFTAETGQPFSVTDSGNFSGTGLGIDYADRVPNVPLYVNGRLNINAFTDNAPGTFGNSGRNAYRAPGYVDVDMALMKNFPIKDRFNGTFRAEAFDILNHPNYFPPNSSYASGSTTFGAYTLARDPRILQFSLKMTF